MSRIIPPLLGSAVGGGGGGYVAKAVQIDGITFLDNAALSSSDGADLSSVIWFKTPTFGAGLSINRTFWQFDPNGNVTSISSVSHDPSTNGQREIVGWSGDGTKSFGFSTSTYDPQITPPGTPPDTGPSPFDQWICAISSINTTTRKGKTYFGDTDVTGLLISNTSDPFSLLFSGIQLYCFSDGVNFYSGDVSDFRLMPALSLLDGSGDIPLATRRLFIDANGKPVDPAAATASLGTAGAVLFSGDATTFPVNQGTGGPFTLTGALTNASSSPSD